MVSKQAQTQTHYTVTWLCLCYLRWWNVWYMAGSTLSTCIKSSILYNIYILNRNKNLHLCCTSWLLFCWLTSVKRNKLSYCRDSTWCHSRSLKVIRCCANRRGIYDFLLALNSNLTSIFNRFWDIMPRLHIHTTPLVSSRRNWKKTAVSRWIRFDVRVPRTLDYPTINLNLCKVQKYDHNAHPSQTDRWTNI